jgi:hypothetical protein
VPASMSGNSGGFTRQRWVGPEGPSTNRGHCCKENLEWTSSRPRAKFLWAERGQAADEAEPCATAGDGRREGAAAPRVLIVVWMADPQSGSGPCGASW